MDIEHIDGNGRAPNDAYYNTVGEKDPDLFTFEKKAEDQTKEVLEIMQEIKKGSPSQVWRRMKSVALLTSVRRAMTVLTKRGELTKTTERTKGPFGRSECVWTITGGSDHH